MRFLRQRMVGDDNATLALTITAAVKSSPENLQASEAALHLFQYRSSSLDLQSWQEAIIHTPRRPGPFRGTPNTTSSNRSG
jgi:hypothetical protein